MDDSIGRHGLERFRRILVEMDKVRARASLSLPIRQVSAVGCYFQRNIGDRALGEATAMAGKSAGWPVSRHPLSPNLPRLSSDGVVLGGGGILTPHFRDALGAVSRQVASRGIPISMVGLSGGFTSEDLGDEVVSMLLSSTFIGVRDQQCAENIRRIGRNDVVVHPDLAFSLYGKLRGRNGGAPKAGVVGFNTLPVMMKKEAGRWRPATAASPWFKKNYPVQAANLSLVGPGSIAILKSVIKDWVSRGLRVRHVPFAEEDANFARDALSSLPIEFLEPTTSVYKTFKRVSECNEFVAMRFHSAVFALMARVPVRFLSYAPKGVLMWRDLGLSDELIARPEDWIESPGTSRDRIVSRDGAVVDEHVLLRLEQEAQRAGMMAFQPFKPSVSSVLR